MENIDFHNRIHDRSTIVTISNLLQMSLHRNALFVHWKT